MSKMYIRVKADGFIYDFNPILAKNPDCEVVPEEIAYPERFIPPAAVQRVAEAAKVTGRKKKGALDLSTDDIFASTTFGHKSPVGRLKRLG